MYSGAKYTNIKLASEHDNPNKIKILRKHQINFISVIKVFQMISLTSTTKSISTIKHDRFFVATKNVQNIFATFFFFDGGDVFGTARTKSNSEHLILPYSRFRSDGKPGKYEGTWQTTWQFQNDCDMNVFGKIFKKILQFITVFYYNELCKVIFTYKRFF